MARSVYGQRRQAGMDVGGDITRLLQEMFGTEEEQKSITSLSNYENNFSNKWNRAGTTGGLEDIDVLNSLKISNKNLYNSMTKNMSPDKKIPITDSYNANNKLIDRQIKIVNDYSAYKNKINLNKIKIYKY